MGRSGSSWPTCLPVGNLILFEEGRPTHWERRYFMGFESLAVDRWESGGAEDRHVQPSSLSPLQDGWDPLLQVRAALTSGNDRLCSGSGRKISPSSLQIAWVRVFYPCNGKGK